jgi:hypothetical protein
VSKSKEQFELGFVVSAICVIHVVCISLLAGMTSSTAAQIADVVRKLSDRDASANYLLYFGGEPANTASNTVVPSGNDPDTVRVTVTY